MIKMPTFYPSNNYRKHLGVLGAIGLYSGRLIGLSRLIGAAYITWSCLGERGRNGRSNPKMKPREAQQVAVLMTLAPSGVPKCDSNYSFDGLDKWSRLV